MSDVTRLLETLDANDPRVASALLPLIYDELRRLARSAMRQERTGHTLEATALVHEAYLRLMEGAPQHWDGRRHFFAAAAEAMRRILVEHARAKKTAKRGGDLQRIGFHEDLPAISLPCDEIIDLLALDEALEQLARENPEM